MAKSWGLSAALCVAAVLGWAGPAAAQYSVKKPANPATGEKYHVEVSGVWWRPGPDISISSESLGIAGSVIDFVDDLGIVDKSFSEVRTVLRFARKHKLRFDYLPVSYFAQTVLSRTIIFNGQQYTIGMPIQAELSWDTYRLAYEWDFLYRDRWFAGVLFDVKYTDVRAQLDAPVISEYAEATGPIPSIGGVFRGYVLPNVSITGQCTFFGLPKDVLKLEDYDGSVVDFDIYGTINFTNNIGAQVGYRSVDVSYTAQRDTGDLKLSGFYIGGAVRF